MEPGARIEFDVRTPVARSKMIRNRAWAIAQGYSDVPEAPERTETVDIVANGPSAVDAQLGPLVLSLNGSLKLFEHRRAPTWWAACDPQPIVASFLTHMPQETTYLVASKCDRSVFKALLPRNVLIWHIDDVPGAPWAVPTGTSITITALSLMRRMGFRKFRVWGWDGCYLYGRDHAVGQPHKGNNVRVQVDGETFDTTTTWAVEAQDAVNLLSGADFEVDIRGPGMIRSIVQALVPKVRDAA